MKTKKTGGGFREWELAFLAIIWHGIRTAKIGHQAARSVGAPTTTPDANGHEASKTRRWDEAHTAGLDGHREADGGGAEGPRQAELATAEAGGALGGAGRHCRHWAEAGGAGQLRAEKKD